ncbi:MAG: response regulator [Candidatus Cloacimonetes bacterium]|nr:response regulator [Candidatus Cloacimonadota bacterium]
MKNKIKILIVESQDIVVLDLQATLLNAGYDDVASAATGDEAIKKVKELKPDIIILNYYLFGRITGIVTAKQIKKFYKAPIMIYSNYKEMTKIINELKDCLNKLDSIESCITKVKYDENKKLSI